MISIDLSGREPKRLKGLISGKHGNMLDAIFNKQRDKLLYAVPIRVAFDDTTQL